MFQCRIDIFISHSWHHSGHYDTLRSWIFEEAWTVHDQRWTMGRIPLLFYDNSVPKEDPIHISNNTYLLENAISMKILNSHVVVIPTGMYAQHSYWIQKEIDIANQYQKPKLAVNPWGQKKSSGIVRKNADAEAGWNQNSIIKKIWKLYNRPSWPRINFLPP